MIEVVKLKTFGVVTALAGFIKLSFVHVVVASGAARRVLEPAVFFIRVALLAGYGDVFVFEFVTRISVMRKI